VRELPESVASMYELVPESIPVTPDSAIGPAVTVPALLLVMLLPLIVHGPHAILPEQIMLFVNVAAPLKVKDPPSVELVPPNFNCVVPSVV